MDITDSASSSVPARLVAMIHLALIAVFLGGCFSAFSPRSTSEETDIVATSTERDEELKFDIVYRGEHTADELRLSFERERACLERGVREIETSQRRNINYGVALIDLLVAGTLIAPIGSGHDAWFLHFMTGMAGIAWGTASLIIMFSYPRTIDSVATTERGDWEATECSGPPVANSPLFLAFGDSVLYEGRTDGDGQIRFPIADLEEAYRVTDAMGVPHLHAQLQPGNSDWNYSRQILLPDDLIHRLDQRWEAELEDREMSESEVEAALRFLQDSPSAAEHHREVVVQVRDIAQDSEEVGLHLGILELESQVLQIMYGDEDPLEIHHHRLVQLLPLVGEFEDYERYVEALAAFESDDGDHVYNIGLLEQFVEFWVEDTFDGYVRAFEEAAADVDGAVDEEALPELRPASEVPDLPEEATEQALRRLQTQLEAFHLDSARDWRDDYLTTLSEGLEERALQHFRLAIEFGEDEGDIEVEKEQFRSKIRAGQGEQ